MLNILFTDGLAPKRQRFGTHDDLVSVPVLVVSSASENTTQTWGAKPHVTAQLDRAHPMECGKSGRKKKIMGIYMDRHQGGSHQIRFIHWADTYWSMPHSKEHWEQMVKEPIEEAKRWDLEPKPASLWWSSTHADGIKEDMTMRTQKGQHTFPFELQHYWVHLQPTWQITRKVWKTGCTERTMPGDEMRRPTGEDEKKTAPNFIRKKTGRTDATS